MVCSVLGLDARSMWTGKGVQTSPLFPLPAQPSGSIEEPGAVAADPRVRAVQQEHREGEKGGAGANFSHPILFIIGGLT